MFAPDLFALDFWSENFLAGEGPSTGECLDPAQAMQYLSSIGLSAPPFMVALYIQQVCSIQDCLAAHYPAFVQQLIKFNLLGLLAFASGDKYVASESAPNGASRSYRYRNEGEDKYSMLVKSLRALDTEGCTEDLIPADPTKQEKPAFAGLWVGRGGCEPCDE